MSVIEAPIEPWQAKIKPAYATFEEEGIFPEGTISYIESLK